MTKNITVVDEQGNEYGATYPKRAKGLVKNGRARFIDENKICLACPPNEFLEDNMNENINITNEINKNEANQTQSASLYTMDYCLAQIAKIQSDSMYLKDFFAGLPKVSECNNEFVAQEHRKALVDAIKCRETTNQLMLEFYNKMYDDLRPVSMKDKVAAVQNAFVNISSDIANNCEPEDVYPALTDIADKIKELVEQIIKN